MGGFFETIRDSILGEVPVERAQNIGEHKSNVAGQGFSEDGGQNGECIVSADSDAWDSAIDEDKDSRDRVDVILDLSRDAPLVGLVLLKTVSIS